MHKTLYTPALRSYVAWLAGVLVVVTGRRTRDQEVACFIPGRFAANTDSGQDCSQTRPSSLNSVICYWPKNGDAPWSVVKVWLKRWGNSASISLPLPLPFTSPFLRSRPLNMGLGSAVSSPARCGPEPQRKSSLLQFSLIIWHLVAPI